MNSSPGLLALFFIFFYVGLFTIGGGLVAITLMQQIIVDRFNLIDVTMFYNMVAVSESTPGPIGINMATYIGTQLYGAGGGIITTLGVVMPSLIVIVLIAKFFLGFEQKPIVQKTFSIIRATVTGVIAVALARVFCVSVLVLPVSLSFDKGLLPCLFAMVDIKALFFYAVSCILLFKAKMHPVLVIVLGAFFGVIYL